MKFYVFNSDFNLITELEEAGVYGNLFIYNSNQADFFTLIARDIDVHKHIKYMVAIRPYVISPEYLVMIDKSIKSLVRGSRLQLNLISGHIKPDEEKIARTMGPVTNQSTPIERSNYLIDYVELLNTIPEKIRPDYYISVSNDFTFNVASKHNEKMIISYAHYLDNKFNLEDKKVMISVTPIIREKKEDLDKLKDYNIQHRMDLKTFTYDEMTELVNKLMAEGIEEMIFSSWNAEDMKEIVNFIKRYNGR